MQDFAVTDRPPLDQMRTVPGVPEDERTVRVSGMTTAAMPTASATDIGAEHPLPFGTMIEGFRITGLVGEGGFGVVYRAWDETLERHVAIKEYMPASLAVRGRSSFVVSVRSERQRQPFDAGLKSFVNEARLLARFDHPALVKVFRYWEANQTAYMAMPYYEGPTLKSALEVIGGAPSEAMLRGWLAPLLDALSVLHRQNCFHRDIAPDNILLTSSGPLLLDFGAARHVITGMTQALTVVLKPGFAPIEQYGGMEQGAWTDLYALAGVMRYAITGRPPVAAVARVLEDTMVPLAVSHAGRFEDGLLRAIDTALAVRPEQRPQSVEAFRELLNIGLPAGSPLLFEPTAHRQTDFRNSGLSVLASAEPAAIDRLADPAAEAITAPAHESTQRAIRVTGKKRWIAAGVALLVLVGAAILWQTSQKSSPVPGTASAPALPSADVSRPAGAPAPGVTSQTTPALSPLTEMPVRAPAVQPSPSRPSADVPAAAPPAAGTIVPPVRPVPAAGAEAKPQFAPDASEAKAPGDTSAAAIAEALRLPEPRKVAPPDTSAVATQPAERAAPTLRAQSTERRKSRSTPAQPADESRAVAADRQIESTPTNNERRRPARCSDILRKASLEPLDADEAAYLRRECR